ncbi:hypothetical protein SAMN05428944_7425 [Streptomyces sp. 1222.5]|uniref:DUF6229 family protein n=1 Tax=unclassified Streptomyces TaxID=2593676 RepID=UPI0008944E77|nr:MULTISPECIES: DUF6229 family protein [unclassified Streptomyces]PKW05549.1 hypothetical protein BX260_0666 [Streptomyces sp. 5112.2]SEC20387.1 hypothetical protein SAMN05216532_0763 [Streptomyces sp. 2231.1]SED36005.1 hypothetical protein SAMN05428944_7425 [Streptomyces sp. 1222.5]
MSQNSVRTAAVLEAWLSGAETAYGEVNPAGPLYVGGTAAEAALTDPSDSLYGFCSSPSGSRGSWCC